MFSGPDLEAFARAKKILETPARELGPYNMGEKYIISEASSNAQWEMITGKKYLKKGYRIDTLYF